MVAGHKLSSDASCLVDNLHTSTSPRILRHQQREKRSLNYDHNNNTTTISGKDESKRLTTTAQINSIVEDRLNSNTNSFINAANGINLSKGADGIDVNDILIIPSEGARIIAQLIVRNTNTYLGRMLCNDRHASNTHSRKPNTTSIP